MNLLNPFSTLETIGIALVLAASTWAAGEFHGHSRGVDSQKVADQLAFDEINKELAAQKVEANGMLQAAFAKNAAEAASQASRTHQLEEQHVQDTAATAAANNRTPRVLRITVPKDAGCGSRSPGPIAAKGNASGPDATTTVELPAEVSRSILQVGFDANTLADNYRACYEFVNPRN